MCDDVFAALEAALKPMNTTKDVAECGITERTLAYWRTTGLGPKYVKVGRTVLYPKEECVCSMELWPVEHRVSVQLSGGF